MPKAPPTNFVAEGGDSAPRKRDRERTLNELKLALGRLQRAGKKVTLRAVAKEA